MKSGNLNFLEPSGPLQACNGTALPLSLLVAVSAAAAIVVAVVVYNNLHASQNITNLRSRALLKKLIVPELFKKFLAFYGTRRFADTCAYPELQKSRPRHATPSHPIYLRYILTLSSHPRLGLSLRSPHQEPVCTSRVFYTCNVPDSSVGHRNNIW